MSSPLSLEPRPTAPQLPTIEIAICCNLCPNTSHALTPKFVQLRNQLTASPSKPIQGSAWSEPSAPPRAWLLSEMLHETPPIYPKYFLCLLNYANFNAKVLRMKEKPPESSQFLRTRPKFVRPKTKDHRPKSLLVDLKAEVTSSLKPKSKVTSLPSSYIYQPLQTLITRMISHSFQ